MHFVLRIPFAIPVALLRRRLLMVTARPSTISNHDIPFTGDSFNIPRIRRRIGVASPSLAVSRAASYAYLSSPSAFFKGVILPASAARWAGGYGGGVLSPFSQVTLRRLPSDDVI
jgi:hypothetical protein